MDVMFVVEIDEGVFEMIVIIDNGSFGIWIICFEIG